MGGVGEEREANLLLSSTMYVTVAVSMEMSGLKE